MLPSILLYLNELLIFQNFDFFTAQNYLVDSSIGYSNNLTWCTVSAEEQNKCVAFSLAVERDISLFGGDFKRLVCKQGSSKEDCMSLLDQEQGDITTLDAGEVFIGGRYHSLVPILQEVRIFMS